MAKRSLAFWVVVVALVIYRIALPLRAGQFGPDESVFMMRAASILAGLQLPLVGLSGNYGVYYGPYPSYYFAALYGMTGFSLGWAFLISTLVLLSAPFVLAATVRQDARAPWILLLGLSSPLAITFSVMGLWDTPLLIPLSALMLFLGSRNHAPSFRGDLMLGILLGIAAGTHLQAVTFVAGVFVWRLLITQRVRTAIAMILGLGLTLAPYVVGLWRLWDVMLPVLRPVGQRVLAPDVPAVMTGLFRFFGAHPQWYVNQAGFLLHLEGWLTQVTSWTNVVLLLITLAVFVRGAKKLRNQTWRSSVVTKLLALFVICTVFYIPFALITNTGVQPHYGQALWWFAPVVIPIVLYKAMPPRVAFASLALLLALNILTTATEYSPRLVAGTSVETIPPSWGHGASWWMQESIAEQLYDAVKTRTASGESGPVLVELAYVKYIWCTLQPLMIIKHPNAAKDIRWYGAAEIPSGRVVGPDKAPSGSGEVLRVEPDSDGIHLRVVTINR